MKQKKRKSKRLHNAVKELQKKHPKKLKGSAIESFLHFLDRLYEESVTSELALIPSQELDDRCRDALFALRQVRSIFDSFNEPMRISLTPSLSVFDDSPRASTCTHHVPDVLDALVERIATIRQYERPLARDVKRYGYPLRIFVVGLAKTFRRVFKEPHTKIVAEIANAYFFDEPHDHDRYPELGSADVHSICRDK